MWNRIKSNSVLIGLGFAVLFFIWYNNRPSTGNEHNLPPVVDQDDLEAVIEPGEEVEEDMTEEIIVDVKGAVRNPGVYEMDSTARVNDVIEKAGGFTEDAIEEVVNLAETVYDEMHIVIPTEEDDDLVEQSIATAEGTHNKVSINQADQSELETLNGIGPSKAEAIISYRDENGPFKTVEDLLNVSGIGEKTLENFQDDIQIP